MGCSTPAGKAGRGATTTPIFFMSPLLHPCFGRYPPLASLGGGYSLYPGYAGFYTRPAKQSRRVLGGGVLLPQLTPPPSSGEGGC